LNALEFYAKKVQLLKSLKLGNINLYVFGIRSANPKIPCSPGFLPVMIEDHATEETSGMEDSIFLNISSSISLLEFGMIPFLDKLSIKSKGT